MKAIVEHEVDISRSPEDVFDYCSDHSHEPEWNPALRHMEKLTDGPVGLGTRYQMDLGRGDPIVAECVRFERPAAWALAADMPRGKAGFEGRVLPAKDGAHLAMRMWIEPRGLAGLAVPLIRRRLKPQWQRDISNIKSILERSAPQQPPTPGERTGQE
jgi:uncharacterized protein YndB with AHSA1/START domain